MAFLFLFLWAIRRLSSSSSSRLDLTRRLGFGVFLSCTYSSPDSPAEDSSSSVFDGGRGRRCGTCCSSDKIEAMRLLRGCGTKQKIQTCLLLHPMKALNLSHQRYLVQGHEAIDIVFSKTVERYVARMRTESIMGSAKPERKLPNKGTQTNTNFDDS